jgi:hypothetical protein
MLSTHTKTWFEDRQILAVSKKRENWLGAIAQATKSFIVHLKHRHFRLMRIVRTISVVRWTIIDHDNTDITPIITFEPSISTLRNVWCWFPSQAQQVIGKPYHQEEEDCLEDIEKREPLFLELFHFFGW